METEAEKSQAEPAAGTAPAAEPRESLAGPIVALLVTHGVMPLGLAFVLLVRVPHFVDIFKSMDVALPSITVIVVNISEIAKIYGLLLPVGLVAFLAVDAVVYCRLRLSAGRIWGKLWWVLVFLVQIAALAAVYLAMMLPIGPLMEPVSK